MGIEWIKRSPEYHVVPVRVYRMRGKKCSISDGLDGMSVCENIGGV